MNLRYKLFLTVGSLFVIAFVTSFFLESKITASKLAKAKKVVQEDILHFNELKRENVEKFLTTTIAESLAEISALLENIADYKQILSSYAPTPISLAKGTWISAATTLISNKWIDFIQNTDEGRLASLIIPDANKIKGVCHVHIDKDLAWITLNGEEPLIGVRFYIDLSKDLIGLPAALPGVTPSVFLLFSPEEISDYLKDWKPQDSLYMKDFLLNLKRAESYAEQIPKDPEERAKWIKNAIAHLPPPTAITAPFRCIPDTLDNTLKVELERLLRKNDQLFMIWRLADLFGKGPFAPGAPKGIARFYGGEIEGEGFLVKDVFSNQVLFNDKEYYEANRSGLPCWHPATSIAIINPPEEKNVFLGNTLQAAFEGQVGYVTVGRNVDHILLEVALSMHQTVFLVHKDQVVTAMTRDGNKITAPPDLPIDKMLKEKNGILEWRGEKYFFLHMIPFPSLDLHFFIIELEDKEFAFIKELDLGAKKLVASLAFDMRVAAVVSLMIVLLMLHILSKRITRPVTQLADAARMVGAGHLDEVKIPEPPEGQHDEVAFLCQSFANMVQGLKEKEKVKAVLNKVVSEEIAYEILRGNVHLGGEEKLVTVLFADIRDFTHLTSKMNPTEVIELLNTCMTKISQAVDDNGGVIDKYVGDELMALFGAPIEKPYSAVQAVSSAIQMIENLSNWNIERKNKGLIPIEMGIGIHTGIVLAGNMGADNRLNYTVLGSNVNLAARLCSGAQGGQILISRATYDAPGVKERIEVEPLPLTKFKGFEEAMEVFAVKGFKQ